MQTSALSTLNPARSRDALQKLRAAAESEAATIPPGVISVAGGELGFDVERGRVPQPAGDPNDQVGAAKYQGQNSPHIGNGHGTPQ